MSQRQSWFEGWRLLAVLTLSLVALSLWVASMRQFEVEGVRMVIRFTARSSLLLFCLAFSATALARLWPNAWTHWQRRNRRYLGLSFAASHAIHAVAIIVFAKMDPAGFAEATSPASYIFGGIGYAVDQWRGTAPWGLFVGLVLGLTVGFYELAKVVWHR